MFSYFEDPINLNGFTMGFLDGNDVWICRNPISIDFIRDKADLKKIDEIISKMTDDNHVKSSLILLRREKFEIIKSIIS